MRKTLILLFFLFSLLPSCIGTSSFSSNDVRVIVTAFHADSLVRTDSGRPYIRAKGTRQVCRWRPFTARNVRSQLRKHVDLSEATLNKYFFSSEEEESTETESNQVVGGRPIYYQTEGNWTKFGLVIQNSTEFTLVIDTIKYHARASCGDEILDHNGEFDSSYCSSEGETAPYLYIVPPAKKGVIVKYIPKSANPFDNLTLIIDQFPIIDRTDEPSTNLRNAFRSSTTGGDTSVSQNRGCQPNETVVIPSYTIELTLIGYFIIPDGPEEDSDINNIDEGKGAEEAGYFVKRVTFQTTTL